MTSFRDDLNNRLRDPCFAIEYGGEIAKAEVGLILALARSDKEITQLELARKLGVKQSYIAKLESGDANPSVTTVGRVLAALNLRMRVTVENLTRKE